MSSLTTIRSRRIMSELRMITDDPIEGIEFIPSDDIYRWNVIIHGPEDTPYKGGKFKLLIVFPQDYPFHSPLIKFETKIFHPNISSGGDICIDILRDAWAPGMKTQKIMLSILSLLSLPNPDDPLVPEIAVLYKYDRKNYDSIAKEFTQKFA